MADYSTFVECGDVAFYPPGATDEKHLETWREYDNLHRGKADDPTYEPSTASRASKIATQPIWRRRPEQLSPRF
jgi:hypothetical protein